MEIIKTSKGKDMLIDDGYLYVFQKILADDVQSWECTERRKNTSCRARVKIQNDQIIARVNQHTHAPNRTRVEVQKVRVQMKRRAETILFADVRSVKICYGYTSHHDVCLNILISR